MTYTPLQDLKLIEENLKNAKVNPKDLKMRLAREIVAIYHGDEKARLAEDDFRKTFERKGVPSGIKEIKTKAGLFLSDLLCDGGIVESKSDFRRLVLEGAICFIESEDKITDPKHKIEKDTELRVGKKRFVRIHIIP